jgi:pimeloyl-ACP methyl ester carboxylesterase
MLRSLALALATTLAALAAPAARYPVQFFPLQVESQALRMAYRDVPPSGAPNGRTVVLLHGKNFSGFYWERVMALLAADGFRVIAPDQLGFGASSRPELHYSFHQMAGNTKALLDALGVKEIDLVGHSMGGMVAVRFALLYPAMVKKLVLENPIGLEDYRLLAPYVPLDVQLRRESAATVESMRDYQRSYYTAWKAEYEPYVQDQAAILATGEAPRAALASALTYAMIYEQPVVYELPGLTMPTLLIIGQADRTAVGKAQMTPEKRALAGQYPQLGRRTREAIPGAALVEVPATGHIPHIETPQAFDQALRAFIAR